MNMDIYLLKISDTEAINIGSGNLRSIKKIRNLINESEIKDYEDKVMSYLNYLGTVGKKEQTYNGPVYSNVDYPNKTVGAVLMEMVTNQCGKCPDPVYEYTYEISLDGIEKKIIDQETYDRLCDMTNCIENKL